MLEVRQTGHHQLLEKETKQMDRHALVASKSRNAPLATKSARAEVDHHHDG